MPSSRIIYQNWIAELGRDPSEAPDPDSQSRPESTDSEDLMPTPGPRNVVPCPETERRREQIREAVGTALAGLTENERELVEQIHYMGRTCREIAERSGRTEHRVEAMHQRALRKLRRRLAPLVREMFGIGMPPRNDCPICSSPDRRQIDALIHERAGGSTWRPVMREIRSRFGLRIKTPQTLIGHEKYH